LETDVKPELYMAYSKWMKEFMNRWDYTIYMIIIGVFALIGFGTCCWLFKEWIFNRIEL
jgi:hypothetical protein